MDMAGNVWEWTLSLAISYPYRPLDGRNDPDLEGARVLRGGSFDAAPHRSRCAARAKAAMRDVGRDIGFRLALSPLDSAV
jgi:formylglycine-generating enzyme required for sulfatase activity